MMDDEVTKNANMPKKDVWDEFEALYGAWADIPEDIEQLFDDLRAGSTRRLDEIYSGGESSDEKDSQ